VVNPGAVLQVLESDCYQSCSYSSGKLFNNESNLSLSLSLYPILPFSLNQKRGYFTVSLGLLA